jgi:predicted acyl esterase
MPGRPYEYQIHLANGYEFGPATSLAEISSSDYPQFAPNPKTGAPFGADAREQTAAQTILHDVQHPSAVTLPVIPG